MIDEKELAGRLVEVDFDKDAGRLSISGNMKGLVHFYDIIRKAILEPANYTGEFTHVDGKRYHITVRLCDESTSS